MSDFSNGDVKATGSAHPDDSRKKSDAPPRKSGNRDVTLADWKKVIWAFASAFIVCIAGNLFSKGWSSALNMLRVCLLISLGIAAVFGIYFLLKGIVLGLIWLCRRLMGSAKKEKEPEDQAALPENSVLPPEYRDVDEAVSERRELPPEYRPVDEAERGREKS